jgi:hypothetical protein
MTISEVALFLGVTLDEAQEIVRSVGFPNDWTQDAIETWLVEGPNTPERNKAARSAGR